MELYKSISNKVPARFVLYLLSWSGFLVSYMLRTDINMAIVAMVEMPPAPMESNSTLGSQQCVSQENVFKKALEAYGGGTIKWSSKVQSYVLSSFHWAYILSQIPGGLATQKYGTKLIFGFGQLITSVGALLIVVAADTHYGFVIAIKIIQGFASGMTWPAMFALVGIWIPAQERSRFMSSFQGFSIGLALTYPLCGFLIAHLGWRSVFYTTGSIGILWSLLWYLLAFDSPETHPRITSEEKQYIQENTFVTSKSREKKIPWKSILTSMPVWSIGITNFGRIWIIFTFVISGPTYMQRILGFSIEANGMLNGAPFFISYVSSVIFCFIADKLIAKTRMSLTNVRKLMTIISQIIPGILVAMIGYVGCNVKLVLVIWFLVLSFASASYAGSMANVVDIAPNFAGSVISIAQTIHMTSSFVSPLINYQILNDKEHLISSWKIVFYVSCMVCCSTLIVYLIWGTGKHQPWDNVSDEVDDVTVA